MVQRLWYREYGSETTVQIMMQTLWYEGYGTGTMVQRIVVQSAETTV